MYDALFLHPLYRTLTGSQNQCGSDDDRKSYPLPKIASRLCRQLAGHCTETSRHQFFRVSENVIV
jgi:hypothetical protein